MVNHYLFLAYSFVWALFMFYAWNLSRRQAKLRRDIENLKRQMSGQANSSQPQS
ncbi:MAG: CcmD family protein [Deltaproteobacteria bacterium]